MLRTVTAFCIIQGTDTDIMAFASTESEVLCREFIFLVIYLLEVYWREKLFVFYVPGPARFPRILHLKHINNHTE